MNKNEKREKPSSEACGKISRAIRRIAGGGQAPNPAPKEAHPSVKALDIQPKPEGGRRVTLALGTGEGKSSTTDSRANKPKSESKRSGDDIEQGFSDYIKRTWLKIRSVSNVGGGKNHSPAKDTRHDHFGDYIARAKKKLRTTSSIVDRGGGRSSSSKRS
ncbi:uncharacterized protein J3R85_011159 [Psidium guajava]|nr:uncharacterized protein J3R85_011159 [Psidium guajava]